MCRRFGKIILRFKFYMLDFVQRSIVALAILWQFQTPHFIHLFKCAFYLPFLMGTRYGQVPRVSFPLALIWTCRDMILKDITMGH